MKCRKAKEIISAYMDDELDTDLSRNITQHLAQCSGCREELGIFQNIDTLIKNLPQHEMSPGFVKKMVLIIRESSTPAKKSPIAGWMLLAPLLKFFENFFELLESAKRPSTHTLEEFSDFPPFSIGCIYFKLLNQKG